MARERDRHHSGRQQPKEKIVPEPEVPDEVLQEIICRGNAVKLNEIANSLGEYYAAGNEKERLSASQIRGVLDHLQRMKFSPNELQLLRPKLAYAAGRHLGKVKKLQGVADKAIVLVGEDEVRFIHFRNFFEAMVAYHRYHGGK